jgi:hypothetical protein
MTVNLDNKFALFSDLFSPRSSGSLTIFTSRQ